MIVSSWEPGPLPAGDDVIAARHAADDVVLADDVVVAGDLDVADGALDVADGLPDVADEGAPDRLAALAELDAAALSDHPAVFERIHDELHSALADIDDA